MRAVAHDGTRRVLLLGTRVGEHDLFEWCCRLVQRQAGALQVEQFAASGVRRAWSMSGTLAVLNAGWSLVLMLEDAPRIAAEPERYLSITRVLSFAARSSGARVAFVQPPPWTGVVEDWPRVRDTVDAAGRASHADIVPIGETWRYALERNPGLGLSRGGSLSPLGAYLAACALARYVADGAVRAIELPGVPGACVGAVHRAVEATVVTRRHASSCEAKEGVRP